MPKQNKTRKEEKGRQNLQDTYERLDPDAAEKGVFIVDKKKK